MVANENGWVKIIRQISRDLPSRLVDGFLVVPGESFEARLLAELLGNRCLCHMRLGRRVSVGGPCLYIMHDHARFEKLIGSSPEKRDIIVFEVPLFNFFTECRMKSYKNSIISIVLLAGLLTLGLGVPESHPEYDQTWQEGRWYMPWFTYPKSLKSISTLSI